MKTGSFPYTFFQGKVTPIEKATISIMTNGFQYGTGYFGGIRGYYNNNTKNLSLFRVDDHIKRFFNSANILGCALLYTQEQLEEILLQLVKKNRPQTDCYFRLYAYVGNTELGPNLANVTLDVGIYMIPLQEYM